MTDPDFRNAFHAHSDVLYRFVYRMTGSPDGADDIVQECFLALWRRPEAYDPNRGALRAFLLGIARNQFSNGGETSIRTTRSKRIRPFVDHSTFWVRNVPNL